LEKDNKKEVPETVLGVKLDEDAINALKAGKETGLIKGLTSAKSGKVFDAYLTFTSNNTIRFRFPPRENKKKAERSNKVPTVVGGVKLDDEDIEDLEAGRETKLIVGIESKKKGKYYDAYLKWNENKGIIFRFPGMD
jgi:hypothetical protein